MAGADITKIYKKEVKKDDGKKKSEPKEIGWEGKLLPKSVVERVYFSKEKSAIEEVERVVAEDESMLEEFVEENSGEDSVLANYFKDNSEDLDALTKYVELADTAKKHAGIVKDLNKALDESVKNKYSKLDESAIKDFLVKQKWSFDIFETL